MIAVHSSANFALIDPGQFGRFGVERGCWRCIDPVKLEEVMSALELAVLIGIIGAFTIFAAVLAWVSRADGGPASARRIPARAATRNRLADRVDHTGRAASA
jgi:hypothetical protein